MTGPTKFLAGCLVVAGIAIPIGIGRAYINEIDLAQAKADCYAENRARAGRMPELSCERPPWGSYEAAERRITALHDSHRDLWPGVFVWVLGWVLVGLIPIVLRAAWRFLLARIGELSAAIRGR